MRERNRLDEGIRGHASLERDLADTLELIELAEAEEDEDVLAEAEAGLRAVRDRAARRQLESLLSGAADANDCFSEAHAGAGGTASPDRAGVRWPNGRAAGGEKGG